MTKRTLSFDLYRSERYGDDKNKPPTDATEFIGWLQTLIAAVPPEHRASVHIEFDDDGDYDCPRPELAVWWSRKETDEEYAVRLSDEEKDRRRRAGEKAAQERMIFEALKRKFEPQR